MVEEEEEAVLAAVMEEAEEEEEKTAAIRHQKASLSRRRVPFNRQKATELTAELFRPTKTLQPTIEHDSATLNTTTMTFTTTVSTDTTTETVKTL